MARLPKQSQILVRVAIAQKSFVLFVTPTPAITASYRRLRKHGCPRKRYVNLTAKSQLIEIQSLRKGSCLMASYADVVDLQRVAARPQHRWSCAGRMREFVRTRSAVCLMAVIAGRAIV